MQNKPAIDQPKTVTKIEVNTSEAAIIFVTSVEGATAAEAAETSMAETSSAVVVAVVVADTVVVTAAVAIDVVAVQAG